MKAKTESERLPLTARAVGAIPAALRWALLIYLAFATACMGLFAGLIEYGFFLPLAKECAPWLILAAAVAGALIALAFWAAQRANAFRILEPGARFTLATGAATLLLLTIQGALAQGMGFVAGSDSGVLADVAAQRANSAYFSLHPHNLFCEGLFTLIAQAATACGADPHAWLVAGGCASVAASVWLGALTARRMLGVTCGVAVFVVGALWLGLSPMAQVPYTDSYGILWPVLTLFLYVSVPNVRAKWALMGAAAVLGYAMKAPSAAVFGGAVIVEACLRLKDLGAAKGRKIPWRRFASALACCTVAALAAFGVVNAVRTLPDVALDPDRQIGAAHYLMMGAGENLGVYAKEDLEFSASFPTNEERTAANLAEWQRRIVERGPVGIAQLLTAKTATVFGNGSFFWGGDGIRAITGTNAALLSTYGLHFEEERAKADLQSPWHWFAQVTWGTVLLGCVLNLLRRRPSRPELVICVALLLFCLYVLTFEANPRYPFIFTPLFLILGTFGWRTLAERLSQRFARRA